MFNHVHHSPLPGVYSMSLLCKFDRRLMNRRTRRSFRGILETLEQRLAPATFVVNSIGDQAAVDPSKGAETASGGITLRSAIQAANAHSNDAVRSRSHRI